MSTVIIMAGGKGKRMCSDLPKVLHKIDSVPMIVRVIQTALLLNPQKILILVPPEHTLIMNTVRDFLGEVDMIKYVVQPEALGTGHAVSMCTNYLNSDTNVIILSGDVPAINVNTLKLMLKKQSSNSCTILTAQFDNPSGLGRIVRINGNFHSIIEDKDCSDQEKKIQEINSGIYVINSELIIKYINTLQNNNAQKEYYITDLITTINKNNHTVSIVQLDLSESYQIRGVNNPTELENLENYLKCI